MPYQPDGSFVLIMEFGTGTALSNPFPGQVGADLDDIASGIDINNIISNLVFQNNVLLKNVTGITTVGYRFTAYNAGTFTSGTFTPDPTLGNYQYFTDNGTFTIAAPTVDCAIDILMTNGSAAVAPTFSGFTIAVGNTGDTIVTNNTFQFIISIRRINGTATFVVKALQ